MKNNTKVNISTISTTLNSDPQSRLRIWGMANNTIDAQQSEHSVL